MKTGMLIKYTMQFNLFRQALPFVFGFYFLIPNNSVVVSINRFKYLGVIQ